MNIQDFTRQHGLKAIVRRHATYNKPALPVDAITMCALIYSRALDPGQLGLSHAGQQMMLKQGNLLGQFGIIPKLIISGIDQRNVEGGQLTALAINMHTGQHVPCQKSPGVTYPYYNAMQVPAAWEKYGDQAVHAYLAEQPGTEGLWTETADAFEARIVSAIEADYGGPVLFDLNFEQVTLLHFLHVEKIRRQDIPFGNNAWCPKNGGGIVYGTNGAVAEFDPDLNLLL